MFNLPFLVPRLTDWKDEGDLRRFLERDAKEDHPVVLTADEWGVLRFNNRCEVAAQQLVDRAAKRGKRLHLVPISKDEYYKWYKVRIRNYHMICGATVGRNDYYYIEPDGNKHWLAIYFEDES